MSRLGIALGSGGTNNFRIGRRVQIIEETNGITYAANKFVWDGTTLCEQRNLTGATVTKRFFGDGE
jgi:hypothetical protein